MFFSGKIIENKILYTSFYLDRKTHTQTGKLIPQYLPFIQWVVGMGFNPESPSSLAPSNDSNNNINNNNSNNTKSLVGSKHCTEHLNRFVYFLERGEGIEKRGREKQTCEKHPSVAFPMPPTGDPACNAGTCPDLGSNQWLFHSQAGAQSTEPHQLGPHWILSMHHFI